MKDKPHILMDDCKGGYLLTKYLIDMGHQHIVGVLKQMIIKEENDIKVM